MKKNILAVTLCLIVPSSFYGSQPTDERTESSISFSFVELSDADTNQNPAVSEDLTSSNWETICEPEIRLIKIKSLIKDSLSILENSKANNEYELDSLQDSWTLLRLLATSNLPTQKASLIKFTEDVIEASFWTVKPSIKNIKNIPLCLGFDGFNEITPEQVANRFKEIKDGFMLLKYNKTATSEQKQQAIKLLQEKVKMVYPSMTEKGKLSLTDYFLRYDSSELPEKDIDGFVQAVEPLYKVAYTFYLSTRSELFIDLYKMYCADEKELLAETVVEYRRLLKQAFFMDEHALFKITEAFKAQKGGVTYSDNQLDVRAMLREKKSL